MSSCPVEHTLSAGEISQDKQTEQPAPPTAIQKRSLFVRSLPASATTDSLTTFFSQSYPLKHATVVSDRTSSVSKGYGFVTFADPSDALAALQAFNGALFDGKNIKVELAEPRSRGSQATDHVSRDAPGLCFDTTSEARHGRRQPLGEYPPRLIVRNLPWTLNDSEKLAMLFRCYGKVKEATVPKRGPGLSAGFGFVLLRGRKNAEKALKEVNGRVLDGRTLAVDWAVRKDVWNSLHHAGDIENSQGIAELEGEGSEAAVSEPGSSEVVENTQLKEDDLDSTSMDGYQANGPSVTASGSIPASGGNEHHGLSTLFVRNVPFTATDETLGQHFSLFGHLRYARVVEDPSTGRSKGTAFICFSNEADAIACLRDAPQIKATSTYNDKATASAFTQANKKSILEDTAVDSSGRYTVDGRLLQLSHAVNRGEAARLAAAGHSFRDTRDSDKRRLYLLNEGTVSINTPLFEQLAPSDISLREESAKQRQRLIQKNPALHLSLTRLSVRNLPRNITSKHLKALAREAVVGFARDVKAGRRQPLSKEELSRAGDLMREAESARKAKGKGIVKQSKIIFEGRSGGKVAESSGAGRSKGYGFIEYTSHRWALMGLRWLNGHAVGTQSNGASQTSSAKDGKKRLIVEFAIENAQVVGRRQERETQSQGRPKSVSGSLTSRAQNGKDLKVNDPSSRRVNRAGAKREKASESFFHLNPGGADTVHDDGTNTMEKSAKKQRVIGRKRMARKARKMT
ncbi:MAG: hypothetical protein LQ343_002144 [Gyalolechia ehrenbergii]|nr:MAG: hypothetical protein LQ343_002144 [Gyalolechia ehrenbergii]